MAAGAILNFENFNFWSRDCDRVQYLMQCTKFHQNRTIFSLSYGDLTIFKMTAVRHLAFKKFYSFCHVTLVDIPFCFLIQNFAEIGQSVNEMAKIAIFKMAAAAILNFKNFNFWSRDCHRVQYLM